MYPIFSKCTHKVCTLFYKVCIYPILESAQNCTLYFITKYVVESLLLLLDCPPWVARNHDFTTYLAEPTAAPRYGLPSDVTFTPVPAKVDSQPSFVTI